jgi:hypothetical protein
LRQDIYNKVIYAKKEVEPYDKNRLYAKSTNKAQEDQVPIEIRKRLKDFFKEMRKLYVKKKVG